MTVRFIHYSFHPQNKDCHLAYSRVRSSMAGVNYLANSTSSLVFTAVKSRSQPNVNTKHSCLHSLIKSTKLGRIFKNQLSYICIFYAFPAERNATLCVGKNIISFQRDMVTHTFAQSFFNELLIGLLLKYEDFSKIWIEFPETLK